MFCWSCGHKNAETNKFCGECGQVQVRPDLLSHRPDDEPLVRPRVAEEKRVASRDMAGESTPEQISKTALPAMRESTSAWRNESKKEEAAPDTPAATFATPEPATRPERAEAAVLPPVENRVESAADTKPVFHSREGLHDTPVVDEVPAAPRRTLAANRITGPSFLGLSDEPSTTTDADYLLDDDYSQPESRSWRGWVAVALLLVFGILAYRQWNYMKATANELAQTTGILNPNYGAQPPAEPAKESAARTQEPTPAVEEAAAAQESSPEAKPEETVKPAEPEPAMARTDASTEARAAGGDTEPAEETVAKPENDAPAAKPSARKKAQEEEPAPRVDNAQLTMAQNYLQGRNGYQQDCSRGMSILRSAAKQPSAKARIQMAALYASGTCVMQNRPEAYYWFARAQEIEPNNTWIERNLNRLWEDMTDEERRRAER